MQVWTVKFATGQGQLLRLMSPTLKPGPETKLTPPTSFWTQNPRWLYFEVFLPFPCEVMVRATTSLTRVPTDSPAARRALEDAGKGWWSLDYILTRPDGTIDPAKPSRMNEARIIVRPPLNEWLAGTRPTSRTRPRPGNGRARRGTGPRRTPRSSRPAAGNTPPT